MKYFGMSITSILIYRIKTILRILKYFVTVFIPNIKYFNRVKQLRNINSKKFAFVFANGPSLGKIDPHKVSDYQKKGYDVFAVNSFISSDFAKIAIPNYYVLSDPAYFGIGMQFMKKERIQELKQDLELLNKYGINLFVPARFFRQFNNPKKYLYNESENYLSNNYKDITKPMGYLSMTAYRALSIACYMGYKKIYICGIDNNYFTKVVVNKKNEIFFGNSHFYDKESDEIDYYKIQETDGHTVGELLYNHHFLFKHLEKFAGYPIVNLDPDSLVDSFTKNHDLDIYM